MQQVVDLQNDPNFRDMEIELLSISPDDLEAWKAEGRALAIRTPLLSDEANEVAASYGVMRWAMPNGEPGHTFVLVDGDGRVAWIRDYGAPENGGAMYVPPAEVAAQVQASLDA
jgi:peroxiredoxin